MSTGPLSRFRGEEIQKGGKKGEGTREKNAKNVLCSRVARKWIHVLGGRCAARGQRAKF